MIHKRVNIKKEQANHTSQKYMHNDGKYVNENFGFQVLTFLHLGGNGGGDNKLAASSYSDVEEMHFAVPRFWICCLSGSAAGGDLFVFLLDSVQLKTLLGSSLLSKSWRLKLLESASNGNFPTL